MLVFSTAGGPQEMEPPEKETNLARTRPTRKLADRLKGDGMHIPFKKVLVPALIASTLAVGALGTPSIVFGKHKTHTFATLPAKASEVKVKPVSGSDALEITIGQKKHTISAVGSLSDIGRLTFSDNFEQLHLGGAGSIHGHGLGPAISKWCEGNRIWGAPTGCPGGWEARIQTYRRKRRAFCDA